eukprot:TRINITY_DN22234_c0_g1_i1.p1 TRINITY_DN22234_c0_g1~~TRINITY_DN22234_c0_g1_i1.p1  ORF type:complete len:155 (-),score=9.33 TRINITY_DN22234_c0_g1_i1:240-641(-)
MEEGTKEKEERVGHHCFSEAALDVIFHFQILKLSHQVYVWVGCNAARMGHLYAVMQTRFQREPSLAVLSGGGADTTGAAIARRLSMRTGLPIVMACSLPSNSPEHEGFAERRLLQEFRGMGLVKPLATTSIAG